MADAEEREFQLQMIEAQTFTSSINMYLGLVVTIAYALVGVFWAIIEGGNSILSGSTIITGNLTGGGNEYSGQVVIPMTNVTAFFSNLKFFEYALLAFGTICFAILFIHQLFLAPRRFKKIRKKFICDKKE
jgi:hypothetical protein